jgi:hypothetical protein
MSSDKGGSVSEFSAVPALRNPVMVAAFEGWNDAGEAATASVEHLIDVWSATQFAELDPEEYPWTRTEPGKSLGRPRDFIGPSLRVGIGTSS